MTKVNLFRPAGERRWSGTIVSQMRNRGDHAALLLELSRWRHGGLDHHDHHVRGVRIFGLRFSVPTTRRGERWVVDPWTTKS